jgi:release factor-specific protein-(glutamine-N5) methyltransferase
MRREPTEPERRLWMALRGSRLQGYKFRRQAIIENRIADFFCPAKGLIVEIDGQTHDREADLRRDFLLERETGFRTVRFTNEDVMRNMEGVLVALADLLARMPDRWGNGGNTTPQPPPLKGRGGSVAEALREAAQALAASSESPRLEAELLMAHALGVTRSDLLLRHMGEPVPAGFAVLLGRRQAHEPVAYILGHQEFYGLAFSVSPAVLIPRGDSETLVEAAREALAQRPPARVLDLGTGSGALLLAALSLWPEATGTGTDRSGEALAVAAANAAALGMAGRTTFAVADWTAPGWADGLGQFDLILSNPPYVEDDAPLAPQVRAHEPAGALFAGPDGLDDYRLLIPQLPGLLAENGLAVIEIGHTQAEAVSAIARAAGMSAKLHHDLANRPRALELVGKGKISLGKSGGDH